MTKKVILKPRVCKWMLDNQGIYMAGGHYDKKAAWSEIPLFMLGVLANGLPGKVGPKNDAGCYAFTAIIPGFKKMEFYVGKNDFVVVE